MTHDLITAAGRLADTLTLENAALDALDVSGAVALLPAKRSALAALTQAQGRALPSGERPAMTLALNRLQALAAENRHLLRRALTVQARVIGIVAQALPRDEPAGRYGVAAARARAARPVAWSLAARV